MSALYMVVLPPFNGGAVMYNNQTDSIERNAFWQLVELWLEASEAKGCSPSTLDHYRRVVLAFVKWLLMQKEVNKPEDVTPTDIRRWLIHRRRQGISTHTLHGDYRYPKTLWTWLVREELTDSNPFLKVDPPKRDAVIKPDLTVEQVQRLFAACQGKGWRMQRDRALLGLLLDTGLRISEAANLRVGDVLNNCITIRGKGGKHRYVFLSPEVRLALRRYIRNCPRELNPDDPLWIGHQGQYTPNGLQQVIIDIGVRAGITPLGPHRFRRTFATWSLRSGCDIETLRRLMGHSSLSVLQGYLALVETDLQKAHSEHSPIRRIDTENKRQMKKGDKGDKAYLTKNNFPSTKRRDTD